MHCAMFVFLTHLLLVFQLHLNVSGQKKIQLWHVLVVAQKKKKVRRRRCHVRLCNRFYHEFMFSKTFNSRESREFINKLVCKGKSR